MRRRGRCYAEAMYAPAAFREERLPVLHEFIQENGFAAVVTSGPAGLTASHIPVDLDPAAGPYGTLRGHLARANPQWRELDGVRETLVIVEGPHAYVSPSWYAAKREHGRVVPTWDYVAVHAWGKAQAFDDRERLRSVVESLTARHEGARPTPWRLDDAPADYVEAMLGAIVGFEMTIERLEGSWKLSQNRSADDRRGVIEGLASGSALEQAVARIIPR